MVTGDDALERLLAVIQRDADARTRELAKLNEQLETRNQLLEKQLARRAGAAKWFALVAGVAALVVAGWVYLLVLNLGDEFNGMSAQMGQMHGYMKNMAAGEPVEGQDSYMSSMAHDIHRMSNDIAAMRIEMTQVSGDIGVMRTAMTQMGGDIGNMNGAMGEMGGDMKSMRQNIDGMAQSLNHMGRNVGRLSRDARQLRDPFGGMMPW
jgi:hypothetical protein